MLFDFVLTFSGWRYVCFAVSETFVAMQEGLQNAMWAMGGVPLVWRSDNLSAASRSLNKSKRRLTERYGEVLAHYGAQSSRIQPGEPHENGCAERAHRTLKQRIEQALILRGSREFSSLDEYKEFVAQVVSKLNAGRQKKLEEERIHFLPLPAKRLDLYDLERPMVRKWSVIQVQGMTYSVPSRLIGYRVDVRIYNHRIEVWYKDAKQLEIEPVDGLHTHHRIDYRHVIESLVRKPGAFARYRFRQEMFPSLVFRRAYDRLQKENPERADKLYLRILWLAAQTSETEVEQHLSVLLDGSKRLGSKQIMTLTQGSSSDPLVLLDLPVKVPDLHSYDLLVRAS